MQRESQKSKVEMGVELDRFSNLPSEVVEKILLFLSTKEAARTSVLSRKWRYKWATLPCLVFDEECIPYTADPATFVKTVDHILLLHIGPLNKVKFCHRNLHGTEDIDRWILHLSRTSIREFVFYFCAPSEEPQYQLPSSLFSCQDMVHLELYDCLLKVPSTFMGFQSLQRLRLLDVTLSQDEVEDLIVRCPLLKILHLERCRGFTHLKVDSPNLQFFDFDCAFENLCLKKTLNLKDVTIALQEDIDQRQASSCSSNLVKFFVQLPHVEILGIRKYFLKYLAVGYSPPMLPKPCLYLHTLDLSMNFSDLDEILTALCVLRSSPALKNLHITVRQDQQAVVGEVNSWIDNQTLLFSELRLVQIILISGIQAELDFIRLLLSSSPVLERMTIVPTTVANSSELLRKMIQFKRASANAEIIYLEE